MSERDYLADQDELLKASEVATTFGVDVRTLWNWERSGVLVPVTRIRGQRYYHPKDVARLISRDQRYSPRIQQFTQKN